MRSWRQIRPALHKRCSTISVLMFRRIGNGGRAPPTGRSLTQTGLRDLSLTDRLFLPERLPASRPANGTESVRSIDRTVQQSRCGARRANGSTLRARKTRGTMPDERALRRRLARPPLPSPGLVRVLT